MPLPKRQHSKQRGRKRRTHWKVKLKSLGTCPQCQKPIISHRICPFCGFYKGHQIVHIAGKESRKKTVQAK